MRFKKNKTQILDDIKFSAQNAAMSKLNELDYSGLTNIKFVLSNAIADGVKEAIEELIEQSYTDEDFEKDIGLT